MLNLWLFYYNIVSINSKFCQRCMRDLFTIKFISQKSKNVLKKYESSSAIFFLGASLKRFLKWWKKDGKLNRLVKTECVEYFTKSQVTSDKQPFWGAGNLEKNPLKQSNFQDDLIVYIVSIIFTLVSYTVGR